MILSKGSAETLASSHRCHYSSGRRLSLQKDVSVDELLSQYAAHPALQIIALFAGPFILEEAALLGGAAVAAAGELPAWVALGALYLGIVVSDWALYATGVLASRSEPVRRFIGAGNIEYGRRLLQRLGLAAALTARLVPWLLLPIFVASGFVRVSFLSFALINAVIAFVYANLLFWILYRFDILLFDYFNEWGWLVIVLLLAVVLISMHLFARRFRAVPPG